MKGSAVRGRSARLPEGGPARARRLAIVRAWIIFMGTLVALRAALEVAGPGFWGTLTAWTSRMTAGTLRLLGVDALASGSDLISPLLSFTVILECTGVHAFLIYLAAVVAYPTSWRRKCLGIILGVPSVLVMNQVRLVSLCYIAAWFPDMFGTAHMVGWQSLIILLTMTLWILWAIIIAGRHEVRSS